uniref:Uncharacterized protein n=1 Tax=Acrobeloides nanus TaxID=290746 RepID=A0A914C8H7_9BILA
FVYLRELDLEKINRGTVEKLSLHRQLKKVIVHGCRNYEVLQDFHNLPQLLVVKGEIIGLRSMIGDIDEPGASSSSMSASSVESGSSSDVNEKDRSISPFISSRLTAQDPEQHRLRTTPSPITVDGLS